MIFRSKKLDFKATVSKCNKKTIVPFPLEFHSAIINGEKNLQAGFSNFFLCLQQWEKRFRLSLKPDAREYNP
jgi:hypothetical protein